MKPFPIALAFLASLSCAFAGPTLSVKDKAGRSMEIELVSLTGDRVSFKRTSDGQAFQLPLSTFDDASVSQIRAKQAGLAPAHPDYGVDVVVSKRRQKKDNSWYLVEQTVSAKVTIKNPDTLKPAPPLEVRTIYLGEDRLTGKKHSVLAVRNYEVTLGAGQTDARELEPHTTIYDSDNKGTGNIGGDQYEGYVLFLLDGNGDILRHQTTCAKLNEIFRKNPELRETFKKLKTDAELDEDYKPNGQTKARISR